MKPTIVRTVDKTVEKSPAVKVDIEKGVACMVSSHAHAYTLGLSDDSVTSPKAFKPFYCPASVPFNIREIPVIH